MSKKSPCVLKMRLWRVARPATATSANSETRTAFERGRDRAEDKSAAVQFVIVTESVAKPAAKWRRRGCRLFLSKINVAKRIVTELSRNVSVAHDQKRNAELSRPTQPKINASSRGNLL